MSSAENLQKIEFVKEWLRTGDPFKAGLAVFPGDSGRAMRASWEWPSDEFVLQTRAEAIAESGGLEGLPSKLDLAREVYRHATNWHDPEMKLEAYELTAKILGYIEKPASVNIDNRSITQKVMVVKDHGSDDEWERKLIANQRELTTERSN